MALSDGMAPGEAGFPEEIERALGAVSQRATRLSDVAEGYGVEVSNALIEIVLDEIWEEITDQLEEDPE